MLYDYEAEREIYLIFQDDVNYFGSNFFKEGFKHVFAIERQAMGWICLDPSSLDMMTFILPATYHDEVMQSFVKNNPSLHVLQLKVKRRENCIYPRLGLISCVSAMQYLLGVAWPFIVTPYQLYCKLTQSRTPHIQVGDTWPRTPLSRNQTQP